MIARPPIARMRARTSFAFALGVAATVALAGCGGSSSAGITSKSPAEIVAASQAAAARATSVQVSIRASQGPLSLTTDLALAGDGGRAKLSFLNLDYEVIRIGRTLYVKGNRTFDRRLERRAGVHVPQGVWLKASAATGTLAGYADLTELRSQLGRLLRSSGPLTKGATTTIDGQHTVELRQTARLFTGSLYIAAEGEPYPIEIVKHGRETGQTTFSGWNRPISLSAPAGAVELSKLATSAGS